MEERDEASISPNDLLDSLQSVQYDIRDKREANASFHSEMKSLEEENAALHRAHVVNSVLQFLQDETFDIDQFREILQQMNTSQERSQPPVDEIEIAYNMLSRDLQQYAYTSESIENLNMTYDQLAPEKEELERRKIAIEEEEKNDIVQNAQKTDESQVQQVLERTSQRLMSDYWMRILGDEIVDIFAGELEERGIPNLKGNGFEFLLQFPLTTITSNSTVRLRFTTPRNQFTPSNLLFIQTDASTLTFIRDKLSNFTTDSHQEPWNTFVGGETHILDLLRNGIQNSQPSGTPVDDSQEQTPQQAIEKQQNIARTNEILFMLQQEERNSQNTILSSLSKFLSSLRFFILSLH